MKIIQLFLACVLILTVACGKIQSGISAASKDNTGNKQDIRILCYNIHHANPPSKTGLIDVEAIASVINAQKPDLVALQEVDVHTNRSGKDLHQAEELAGKTGMKAYFAKGINYEGGEYGVAILSKYPIVSTTRHELPTAEGTKGEPRILATAVVTLPGGEKIRFACTHLDAQRNDTNRVLQIEKIRDILKDETLPVIIAGDFNASPDSRIIAALDQDFSRTCKTNCGFTIPEVNPKRTIDFIAFKPAGTFRVVKHKVIDEKYASDHLPVFAVLKQQ